MRDAERALSVVPSETGAAPAVPRHAQAQLLADLMGQVALGDEPAFDRLYTHVSGLIFGIVRRVLRDPAQSEEVAQEVFVEIWRTAAKFDRHRGGVTTWVATMAHRRAVDRVRSAASAADREDRVGRRDQERPYDEVAETVERSLEHEAVRRCLTELTDLQREVMQLAYYSGHTYREVADLLHIPLGTVKTRMRDGLIRLRDCLGVTA